VAVGVLVGSTAAAVGTAVTVGMGGLTSFVAVGELVGPV
jgi:hypothetical protein